MEFFNVAHIHKYALIHTHRNKVRSSGWEELPHTPTPEARGGRPEDQPHVQGAVAELAREGLEELSHVEGQEGRC